MPTSLSIVTGKEKIIVEDSKGMKLIESITTQNPIMLLITDIPDQGVLSPNIRKRRFFIRFVNEC